MLHWELSYRHCSPQTVGTLRSGQQKLTTFWRGNPPSVDKILSSDIAKIYVPYLFDYKTTHV